MVVSAVDRFHPERYLTLGQGLLFEKRLGSWNKFEIWCLVIARVVCQIEMWSDHSKGHCKGIHSSFNKMW